MASCRERNCQPLNVLALASSGQRSWGETLQSWKEIAAYTAVSIRTLQRWQRDFGLSIRRVATKSGSVVFAFRSELNTWLRARSKGAEALMRDEHFRVMFINSPLPTLVLDNVRRILDVNAALCEMWGFPPVNLLGVSPTHFRRIRSNTTRKNGANFCWPVRQSNNVISAIRLAPCWEFNMRSKAFLPANMVAVVATRPGGVPRSDVYYRLGTTSFIF